MITERKEALSHLQFLNRIAEIVQTERIERKKSIKLVYWKKSVKKSHSTEKAQVPVLPKYVLLLLRPRHQARKSALTTGAKDTFQRVPIENSLWSCVDLWYYDCLNEVLSLPKCF